MPATLEAATIDGYAVGKPWNQAAVAKAIGVPVITDANIWKNNPEKVFGVTAEFAKKNPNTMIGLRKSQRRELQRRSADADMTMRAFILNSLREKGLTVTEEDLLDLRRKG